MAKTKTYAFSELVAQCDQNAPMPKALQDWDQMASVGLEQTVMAGQVNIREAVLAFSEKLADRYEATELILFGSRARGDYHPESDADVAVILRGQPRDFVEANLAMAGFAFDVIMDTGVLIQALPMWESEWTDPAGHSNPSLLQSIAREGLILWQS